MESVHPNSRSTSKSFIKCSVIQFLWGFVLSTTIHYLPCWMKSAELSMFIRTRSSPQTSQARWTTNVPPSTVMLIASSIFTSQMINRPSRQSSTATSSLRSSSCTSNPCWRSWASKTLPCRTCSCRPPTWTAEPRGSWRNAKSTMSCAPRVSRTRIP